ncbi:MAG: hypothetical protein R2764_19555 [Bacteroidales bacterium]
MGSLGPDEYLRYNYVRRVDSADVVVTNDSDPLVQVPSGYAQTNIMHKRSSLSQMINGILFMGFIIQLLLNMPFTIRLLRTKNGLPRSAEWNYGPKIG